MLRGIREEGSRRGAGVHHPTTVTTTGFSFFMDSDHQEIKKVFCFSSFCLLVHHVSCSTSIVSLLLILVKL